MYTSEKGFADSADNSMCILKHTGWWGSIVYYVHLDTIRQNIFYCLYFYKIIELLYVWCYIGVILVRWTYGCKDQNYTHWFYFNVGFKLDPRADILPSSVCHLNASNFSQGHVIGSHVSRVTAAMDMTRGKVLVSSVIINLLVKGSLKSLGILLVELSHRLLIRMWGNFPFSETLCLLPLEFLVPLFIF